MVIYTRPLLKQRGFMMTEMVMAMAILGIAMFPLAFSINADARLFRATYQRAIAMEIVDGEMEILAAGEWRNFPEGAHTYTVHANAAANLPAGQFQLTRAGRASPSGMVVRQKTGNRAGCPGGDCKMKITWFEPLSRSATTLSPRSGERAGGGGVLSNAKGGFSLLECLAYIALLAVVLGIATKLFFQAWDDSKALRRNADDIVRVMHAGDRWRADVRSATGPVQVADADGGEQLRIPAATGEIVYTFSNGELRRQNRLWLSNIKASQMRSDLRQTVTAWRWKLELKTVKKTARWRPLFTFEAVARQRDHPMKTKLSLCHRTRQDQHGSAVLVILILLGIMVIFVAGNTATVNWLRREVNVVDKQQVQRLARHNAQTVTNRNLSK